MTELAHLAREFWSSLAQSTHSTKGKAKSKGKHANVLDCGGDGTPEPQQEANGFALCALIDHRNYPAPSWLNATLDPGAARTVHPANSEYGMAEHPKNRTS